MAPVENGRSQYVKLEQRLVLLAWLNSLFGYDTNRDLLKDTSGADEGFDGEGRSFIYYHMIGRGESLRIDRDTLAQYDANIRAHLNAINEYRPEPITLRYFQYLAVLYAEVFLDWYFNCPGELLRELNGFVSDRNAGKGPSDVPDQPFEESDLTKLAFWMATGSGKTLIMHINYRQFLYYNKTSLDNILLITPNEGLTEQHMTEMEVSGIPCARFRLEESGLGLGERDVVRVIEITKLVEEKRGGGVSVDVECFDGNNLIFVDEGHKGTGGEAWRRFRDRLGQTGFTFEYSATFGQALTAARRDELTAEYGKAIAFDYSYKYFYDDGYGKDFQILNLREETTGDRTDTLLLANLLSFYEQKRSFADQAESLRPYGIEHPLWIFVGSSVNVVYTEEKQKRSDVLTVLRFLHRFLENSRNWTVRTIEKVMQGKTELRDSHVEDIFADQFQYIRAAGTDAVAIHNDILDMVFRSPSGGSLHLSDIRGSDGELGLKVGGAENYFGLIYIGDTSAFKKLVDADDAGIIQEEDAISGSLFEQLSRPDSPINVLIGAKKFMEGWNSWRVSNMGLLNIGRSEGSEIIQLFGRGVRLRGLNFSLKRSSVIKGEHPVFIRLLETLNIFAVRANYMAQFREYLEREGVETDGYVELSLAIQPNKEFLDEGLYVPQVPAGRNFAGECRFLLEPDTAAEVTLDISLKVESIRSGRDGLETKEVRAAQEQIIPSTRLELLDWEAIYLEILEYKEEKGFHNLIIRLDVLKDILMAEESRLYRLIVDRPIDEPKSFEEFSLLQETVLSILRKYVEKFYRVRHQRWDSEHMVYQPITPEHPDFLVREESTGGIEESEKFQGYTIRIPRSEGGLIEAVRQLIEQGSRLYEEETRELPRVHFDRHLYQPLLIEEGDKVKIEPPGLNPSEAQFVNDIKEYVRAEADETLASKEVFLLRNLSKGKGVGFFDNEGFYPDFILWIKEDDKQRLVFIEPHGMRHEKAFKHSDKARLHERLRDFSRELSKHGGLDNVTLDSFIISKTKYDELHKIWEGGTWDREKFTKHHILFFDRNAEYDYMRYIFEG